jgi:hypothetical protein
MSRWTMAALNRGKTKVSQHTWIAVSAILLLALAFPLPLSAGPPSDPDTDPEEATWLSEEWRKSRTFWKEAAAKARWDSIPWLRMTTEKKHALWDEALRYALVEDEWLGRPSGEIPLQPIYDLEYVPNVAGLSFTDVTWTEINELAEQHGQFTYMSIRSPGSWQDLSSVELSVSRGVRVSAERRSNKEYGCYRNIELSCERTWGGWECHPVDKGSSECNELAFDDQRWHMLEGLTMTREDEHAMWNSMLEHSEDFLGGYSGTIIVNSDRLDPTFVPAVEGMSFRLLSDAEIGQFADDRGPVEYVQLRDRYGWYRGAETVRTVMYVATRKAPKIEPIAGTSWRGRTAGTQRWVGFKCKKSSVGWSCEPR